MKSNSALVFKATVGVLSIISLVTGLILITKSRIIGLVMLIISILCIALFILELYFIEKNIKRFILRLGKKIETTEKESLYNFPAPAVIIDEENTIVWYNRMFSQRVFSEKEAYGVNLNDLVDIDINKLYTKNGTLIEHDSRIYRVIASRPTGDEKNKLSMVYFNDISSFKALETEHFMSRPCVILIMVDNYEDLLSNVKESEKAHILVEIEKLLENFMEKTTGIIRKVSSDRFIVIVEERHLQKMIANRFDILDMARAIKIDDRLCVTLSIGVGRGSATMSENETSARQALDMALGRGGDQCALKTINGFEFFGGVSKGIEKHAKVKTRIIATVLSELVEVNENILIMGHRFGDLDSIGSAIGLCAVIRKMGKSANVVVEPEKNLAHQLIDYIKNHDSKDMFIAPEEAVMKVTEKTLLIVVDTHNPDFVDSKVLLDKCKQVAVIDHHRKMINHIDNAVIFHHEPYASSTCEMVAELIQYFGDNNKINPYEAEALLSGIMLDTKNFVMRTGVRTFEAAAFLRKLGADTVAVKSMFSSSMETYQLKTKLVSNAKLYHSCAIACSDYSCEEMRIAAPQAADELLGIDGAKASFVIFNIGGVINISARSFGAFNVQLIMEAMGGGGHQTMAGVQIENQDIELVKKKLIDTIDDFEKKSS